MPGTRAGVGCWWMWRVMRVPVGGVDLSRTVGWFTSVHPVRLELGGVDPVGVRAGGPAAGEVLKRVKEQVRGVPGDGLGYGLLRHLNPVTAAVLQDLPEAQIAFNYLGRFPTSTDPEVVDAWQMAGRIAAARSIRRCRGNARAGSGLVTAPRGDAVDGSLTWASGVLDEASAQARQPGWTCSPAWPPTPRTRRPAGTPPPTSPFSTSPRTRSKNLRPGSRRQPRRKSF